MEMNNQPLTSARKCLSCSNSRNWSDAGPGPGLTLPRAITGHTPRAAILPSGVPDTVLTFGVFILRTAYDPVCVCRVTSENSRVGYLVLVHLQSFLGHAQTQVKNLEELYSKGPCLV